MVLQNVYIQEVLGGEVLSAFQTTVYVKFSVVYFVVFVGSEREVGVRWEGTLHCYYSRRSFTAAGVEVDNLCGGCFC